MQTKKKHDLKKKPKNVINNNAQQFYDEELNDDELEYCDGLLSDTPEFENFKFMLDYGSIKQYLNQTNNESICGVFKKNVFQRRAVVKQYCRNISTVPNIAKPVAIIKLIQQYEFESIHHH